ncbi:hypothetical protein PQ478_08815 [Alkalihalophilus pseudofirmus]|uniref:hypothetical protein n=1 Tax=Alkalihalophilus pseudofirmus TaxID=79885 RepID=UPI00259B0A88|nr:hypothetical protein [Alkalihalophilus pseudofirmus]WEG18571.1 hypothetical protein PQ478_08815 [Alkalihalophilus pseudofirmus]
MSTVIDFKRKSVEKQYKALFNNGTAALNLREEELYWKKQQTKIVKIDPETTRKEMLKGYMEMLSK